MHKLLRLTLCEMHTDDYGIVLIFLHIYDKPGKKDTHRAHHIHIVNRMRCGFSV